MNWWLHRCTKSDRTSSEIHRGIVLLSNCSWTLLFPSYLVFTEEVGLRTIWVSYPVGAKPTMSSLYIGRSNTILKSTISVSVFLDLNSSIRFNRPCKSIVQSSTEECTIDTVCVSSISVSQRPRPNLCLWPCFTRVHCAKNGFLLSLFSNL